MPRSTPSPSQRAPSGQPDPPQVPDIAIILLIIGGVLTSLLEVVYVLAGVSCADHGPVLANATSMVAACHQIATSGALGLGGGIGTAISGAALSRWPKRHIALGLTGIVGALVALPAIAIAASGGVPFIIGPLLGILGSIIAITWKPSGGSPTTESLPGLV